MFTHGLDAERNDPFQHTHVLAHGADAPVTITRDRPVTFWTQPGVSMHDDTARRIAADDPRIPEAWAAWSDHVSAGGKDWDFELPEESRLANMENISELEGAQTYLPGTPFKERFLDPACGANRFNQDEPDPAYLEGYARMVQTFREMYGHEQPLQMVSPSASTLLGSMIDQTPGKGPVSVLACR